LFSISECFQGIYFLQSWQTQSHAAHGAPVTVDVRKRDVPIFIRNREHFVTANSLRG
jgi:hypothetical protein